MKVLVSGASGFVGTALVAHLKHHGHHVVHLGRRLRPEVDDLQLVWDKLTPDALQGIDVAVHLAGESIFARWTPEKKARLLSSRVDTTRKLSEALAAMPVKPEVLISCSAAGYYGDRGNELLTEVSASGENYLAWLCRQWEAAAEPAREAGIRVVHPRLGIVLHPSGSSLRLMRWPFTLGVAGNLGNGKQYMPWISRDDVVGAFEHIIQTKTLRGPVNIVATEAVTNAEFTRTMKKVLTWPVNPLRYWAPPLPGWAIRMLAGQMGEELLLSSQKVLPVRLQETGYRFRYPTLEVALRGMLH